MIIGIDVDSVLADLVPDLFKFHNSKYGTNHQVADHTEFELAGPWQCEPEEAIERVYEFYRSEAFKNIKPMPGAIKGVKYLKNKYDLVVITSRPTFIEHLTIDWLDKHFPKSFKEICHTNQFVKKGAKSKPKSEICLNHGIRTIIDDALHFAEECAEKDINVLLYDMPWNRRNTLPKNITRVKSWAKIQDLL